MDAKPYKINYYNNVECKNVDWLWYIGAKKVKESDLIKAISNYLKTVPNLFFWKEHGGMYGTAGIPDLIVCYKGRFIGLECKVGKNTATALQQQTIRQILKAGGNAVVVKSIGEVKAIIQAFEKE